MLCRMTLTSTHLFPWALSGLLTYANSKSVTARVRYSVSRNNKQKKPHIVHTYFTLLSCFLTVCGQCSCTLILCHHSSSIICLSILYFLSFHSSFSCPTWLLFCLFSFCSPSPPHFFLSSVLSAFFLVLFKSNFPLYLMKGTTDFLYLQQTDCIAASAIHWPI